MTRHIILFALLLSACDSADDIAPLSVQVQQIERSCPPRGASVSYDMGDTPVWWAVDIGYELEGDVVWSPITPLPDGSVWVYQDGPVVYFPCGYPWLDGITLRTGEQTSPASRWRITYGVLAQ